jgi:purine-cytosine permease-like protein
MGIYHIYNNVNIYSEGVSIMGLPSTLGGIAGFIIAIIFLIGISATDLYPNQSKNIVTSQNDFTRALNQSTQTVNSTSDVGFFGRILGVVGLDGIYDFIRNFLSMLVSFIVMMVQYVFMFIGIATILPTEFYLLFALMISGTIIALIKLIFLSGD